MKTCYHYELTSKIGTATCPTCKTEVTTEEEWRTSATFGTVPETPEDDRRMTTDQTYPFSPEWRLVIGDALGIDWSAIHLGEVTVERGRYYGTVNRVTWSLIGSPVHFVTDIRVDLQVTHNPRSAEYDDVLANAEEATE